MAMVVETEIEIRAPLAHLWKILTDFSRYEEWNPLIVRAAGPLVAGSRIRISVRLPERKTMDFCPTLVVLEEERELRWRGSLGVPGLFSGEHAFIVTEREGGILQFVHRERFRGLLVPFLSRRWFERVRHGFEGMNDALKARTEKNGLGIHPD
ncbi:MAG: SRPBCC domain-containing protein [Nitrospirae bacterium]|nr:SRPBCC domain-containing protein [Nitrospirota bacterium]